MDVYLQNESGNESGKWLKICKKKQSLFGLVCTKGNTFLQIQRFKFPWPAVPYKVLRSVYA